MVLFDHLLTKTEGFKHSRVLIAVSVFPPCELNRRFLSICSLKPTCSAQVCAVVCLLIASSFQLPNFLRLNFWFLVFLWNLWEFLWSGWNMEPCTLGAGLRNSEDWLYAGFDILLSPLMRETLLNSQCYSCVVCLGTVGCTQPCRYCVGVLYWSYAVVCSGNRAALGGQ